MACTVMSQDAQTMSPDQPATSFQNCASCASIELTNDDEREVLGFLAERPIHTVFMASLIRDNGLESQLNRGSFYGCRDSDGNLEGVALIGHATLVEARSQSSLKALARIAQTCNSAHLIRGERDVTRSFWNHYASVHLEPRRVCSELMLEQRTPFLLRENISGLRQASSEDLNHVLAINSQMATEEAGTNPLDRDPQGFLERTARRIEQGRVWIWSQDGKPIFKADIVADTPQTVYLEGIYINREERGKGYGLRCLTQLGWTLLAHTESLCLTVNELKSDSATFYYKAGYRLRSYYETIYLQ